MSIAGRKVTLAFCEICKKEVKYFNRHLAKHHPEISQLTYFNTYIRSSETQGFCKTCGKPTNFTGPLTGFTTYCDAKCQMKDHDMQKMYKERYKAKTGYEHNFQNPECIAKIRKTQTEKYGGIGWASKEIRKKALTGIDNCMHNPEVVEKVKATRLANNSKWCSTKQLAAIHEANQKPEKYKKAVNTKYTKNNGSYESAETQTKRINTMIKRYGVDCAFKMQSCIPSNILPKTEKRMLEFLKNRNIIYEHNYKVNDKRFDFAIFNEQNELQILVEIDGVYFHGLLEDCNGKKSRGDHDHERFSKVPEGVKFIVCDETHIEECFAEILKVYNIDYESWIKSIVDNMPIEFPYPNYSEKRLNTDWKHLCEYVYNTNSFVGMSIIQQHHKSIWHAHKNNMLSPVECWKDRNLIEKSVRNRVIYKSNLSSHQIARGFNISNIAKTVSVFNPMFAKYIVDKYTADYTTIFDPFSGFSGRMLGTCACNKKYIGQDINATHVAESNAIISKYNLNAEITRKDIFESTGTYECLFTCSPYNLKEIWNENETNLSCDEWIDECLKRFRCKRYIFIVDKTEKYKDNIVETLHNKSHFSVNNEYLVIIDQ